MTQQDDRYLLMQQVASLFKAERVLTSVLDADIRDSGLNAREVYMLTVLSHSPGYAMPMHDMTDTLMVPKSVTTTRIQSMERRGLVVRQEDAVDRRRVSLILTAKGQRVQEIAFGILMASLHKWLIKHLGEADIRFLDRLNEIDVSMHRERTATRRHGKRKESVAATRG